MLTLTLTRLVEVGRKFSKANEAKLRKALESISELLSQLDVSEADRSYSDKQRALQRALSAANSETSYCWIADVFDESLVYSTGGKYYQCSYSLDDAGNATFGDATEVLPQTIYNPVGQPALSEAAIEGDCVPLANIDLAESSALVKLIAPGWGSSGYYTPQTLRNAAAVFTKGLKMFWNHQTAAEEAARPEGDLDKLAAELAEDSRYMDDGPIGPGLYARAKVFERYAPAVKDLKDHIGVSIRASGMARQGEAEGRKGPIVEKVVSAKSTDFVTVPGAGGQIVSLFEAAGRKPANLNSQESDMTKEETQALIAEQVKPLQESLTVATTKVTALEAENGRLRESLVLRDARSFIDARLAKITMPAMTRLRLAEALVGQATVKEGRLDEAALAKAVDDAAKAAMQYLSEATGGHRVQGFGSVPAGEPKKLDEAALAGRLQSVLGLSEAGAKVAAAGR